MEAGVRRFALDLSSPLATADGDIGRREGLLVRVADDGTAGLGEATPLAGWTESFGAARDALREAADVVERDGPREALALVRGAPAARHGLQVALADLAARRADKPLYDHLAGENVSVAARTAADGWPAIPVNATVGDAPPDETAASARAAAEAGFDCVKVKVGNRAAAADTGRLAAVREAVGPDVELRADANGAWTRAQAYEAVRNYPSAAVDVVEQPVQPSDLGGLSALRGNGVEVAVDETVASVGVDPVLDAGAADVVVLKPTALGGLDRTRAAALAAMERGVDVVVSNTVDAVVARTVAGHLAASLPDVRACGLATADRFATDLAPDPAPVEHGWMAIPAAPGTGVDIGTAWAAVEDLEVGGDD
ncbi:MAG: o-succinylbenzoate synthase [Halobacteriales archaeon]